MKVHRQEVLLTCQANQLALEAVKDEMANEAEQEREKLQKEYQFNMGKHIYTCTSMHPHYYRLFIAFI